MPYFATDAMFTLQFLGYVSPPIYGRLITRWRHGRCRASEILNVGMSKPPKVASRPAGRLRGAVSAPAGYGEAPRSQKYVSKMKKKYYLKFKDTRQVTRATHVRNRVCPRVELILKILIILLIIFLGFIKSKPC